MGQEIKNTDWSEWVECINPDMEEKPEYGILLKEFKKGNKFPSVYIVWEREIGKVEKLRIVAIHSSKELAERRVPQLNKESFWDRTDIDFPKIYQIEECEINHYFGHSMVGLDSELDQGYSRISDIQHYFYGEEKFRNLKDKYTEEVLRLRFLLEAQSSEISELKKSLENAVI